MTDASAKNARALRSLAVLFVMNGAVYASFLPRLPELRTEIGVDLATIGLILTLAAVGGLVGSSLTGLVIGLRGSRWAIVLGVAGVIVALPFIGVATSAVGLFAALATVQFFDVWTDAAMNLQGSRISGRRRVPIMNRLHGLWSLGTVAGGAVAALLAGAGLPIEAHLVGVSIVLVVALLYAAPGLLVGDAASDAPTHIQTPIPAEAQPNQRSHRRLLAVLFTLGVAALVIEIVPTEWATFRLREDLGTGLGVAGMGFVAVTTGMMVGRFGGDFAQARLGRARLTSTALGTAAVGLVVSTVFSSLAVTLVGFVIIGLGVAVLLPVLYDDAAKAPGRPGTGLGALTAGIRVGALAAPVLVGVLATVEWISVGLAMLMVSGPAVIVMMRAGAGRLTQT